MIIGLLGEAGSGKDTIAGLLVQHHGFVRVGLADPIKRLAKEIWRFSDAQLWGPSQHRNAIDPRYGFSPREALQRIGTDTRGIDSLAWVRLMLRVAEKITGNSGACMAYSPSLGLHYDKVRHLPPAGVVVSDCRFRNEVDEIRNSGGIVYRVRRTGAGLTGPRADHVSETEMTTIPDDAIDGIIPNNGTVDELRQAVQRLANMTARSRAVTA